MVDFGHELHYFARWRADREFPIRAGSVDFWRGLCPALTISDSPFAALDGPVSFEPKAIAREVQRVRRDGYFKTQPALESAVNESLADAVRRVIGAGFHPLFVSVYDEFWKPLARLGAVLEPVFGAPPRLLGDFWVWCVGPGQAPAGWAPHRDHEVEETLEANGTPRLLTVWIPFTDATPENGCIYALPTSLDPNLPFTPEIRAVPEVQNVIALPAAAGSVIGWNQYILHWGGRCSDYATQPRISTGIYFQSSAVADYRTPVPFDQDLPFEQRLQLIALAFRRYHSTFGFPALLLEFIERHTIAA
jgi:hypothetical protein